MCLDYLTEEISNPTKTFDRDDEDRDFSLIILITSHTIQENTEIIIEHIETYNAEVILIF